MYHLFCPAEHFPQHSSSVSSVQDANSSLHICLQRPRPSWKKPNRTQCAPRLPPRFLSLSADRARKGRPGHDSVEADEASAMSSWVQRYRQWVRADAADSLLARHQHYHTSVGCFLHRIPLLCITTASLWPQHCWDCLYSMTHLTYNMIFIKNKGELLFVAAQAQK